MSLRTGHLSTRQAVLALRRTQHQGLLGFSRAKSTYTQEHDYTVNPNTYAYTSTVNKEVFERFPLVSARALRARKERPRRARMLSREFIEDSMYNPHYGYFSRSAEIFKPERKFDISEMRNVDQFIDAWALEYRKQAKPETKTETKGKTEGKTNEPIKHVRKVSRQLWHTPSELFSPHYGAAIARYILSKHDKREPLEIYETGAGNGTLMLDILNYLKANNPEIYSQVRYHVVEISAALALKQRAQSTGHADKVVVHNVSIHDWDLPTTNNKCFFLAFEVWDNLSHDVIRYDNTTNEPYQGYVVVDGNGDFVEVFSPKLDELASEFLQARSEIGFVPQRKLGWHPLSQPVWLRKLRNRILPFADNLSPPEYIPTKFYQMLKVLKSKFPNHHLIAADFTHFTERTNGYQSPVVQTFMDGLPVTVESYMVLQGYFDIMFPTDFKLAAKLYEHVMGRPALVRTHSELISKFVSDQSRTQAGELPVADFYRNAAFLLS